jgi:Uma2 family endonuclease
MVALPSRKAKGYTYQDYLGFSDELRCEIMDGEIYDMTPAPTTGHQTVTGRIHYLILGHLDKTGHRCEVFISPVDVILSEADVVQPDIVIVCDRGKIQPRGIFGAPDVVFEVLSPSTEPKDRQKKRELYERSGVQEYFLVNPEAEFVEKYTLSSAGYGKYVVYVEKETFMIEPIKLELPVQDLFQRGQEGSGLNS